ncbi:hypothetical protein COCMIDRAFT_109471 [Bipolaris oryzae ATCC 44560]|uniref:Uncharacterized protein n=1 Tax=Bipolaris oryzae ATCC 44560 TaxID=930090 RepID=W6YRF1_COCMI|nr:uncharacterized protein COCMIDRAFT_109471 [Bipolaris oryzae ATCC 44560]EUC40185.1 hypothetical protein COCMIDRAFT_109471 [Bipolaris oryzae ATCC 44560]
MQGCGERLIQYTWSFAGVSSHEGRPCEAPLHRKPEEIPYRAVVRDTWRIYGAPDRTYSRPQQSPCVSLALTYLVLPYTSHTCDVVRDIDIVLCPKCSCASKPYLSPAPHPGLAPPHQHNGS